MLDIFNTDLRQQFLYGARANRIFSAIKDLDVVALNSNKDWQLAFYKRSHSSGANEAGIYHGPCNLCCSHDEYAVEMLRLFSFDERCFEAVEHYYFCLIARHKFWKIIRN